MYIVESMSSEALGSNGNRWWLLQSPRSASPTEGTAADSFASASLVAMAAQFGDVLAGDSDDDDFGGTNFGKGGGAQLGGASGGQQVPSCSCTLGGASSSCRGVPSPSYGSCGHGTVPSYGSSTSKPKKPSNEPLSSIADALSSDDEDTLGGSGLALMAAASQGAGGMMRMSSTSGQAAACSTTTPTITQSLRPGRVDPFAPRSPACTGSRPSNLSMNGLGVGGSTSPSSSPASSPTKQKEAGIVRFRDVVIPPGVVGITCADIPAHLQDAKFGGTSGVLVVAVKPGCGAEAANLRVGDIIVRVMGQSAVSHMQVCEVIRKHGDGGDVKNPTMSTAQEPITLTVVDHNAHVRFDKTVGRVGLCCQAVADARGHDTQAVVVSEVIPGTQIDGSGLLPGCLLVSVNGEIVKMPQQAATLVDTCERFIDIVYRDSAEQLVLRPQPGGEDNMGMLLRDFKSDGFRSVGGVFVGSVATGSAAAAANVRTGDVLLAIDNKLISTAEEAGGFLKKLFDSSAAEVRVVRRI